MEEYQQLINNLYHIIEKYDEIDRINGSKFNIFQVLKIEEEELKHSLFIAELLNPKGRHGLGSQFLKLFLEKVKIADFDIESTTVKTEKHIGPLMETKGGFIDIFLYDKNRNSIVIENKIYADDQPQQLIRYYNFAPQNVLYLTLNGYSPSEKSIIHETIHLKEDEDFKVISHQSHIIEWLELCRKESTNFPLLREGLLHYINIIKHLTGQSTNKKMKEDIIKLAIQNTKNLKAMTKIAANFPAIKSEVQWKFWEKLEKILNERGLKATDVKNRSVNSTKTSDYYHKGERNFGLWILIGEYETTSLYYAITVDHNVFSGFCILNDSEQITSSRKEFQQLSSQLLQIDAKYQKSDYWLGWYYVEPKINFKLFIDDTVFNLIDEEYLNQITSQIADEIEKDIELFKNKITL